MTADEFDRKVQQAGIIYRRLIEEPSKPLLPLSAEDMRARAIAVGEAYLEQALKAMRARKT